ncbi:MAG: right-handed parallel beta-helix repeat-containing protein [Methylobacteriaceae bacterium]|nr:right-handed parallel beta-helix repeat-containing protein [Methylobacteriaceae bacterium]
MNRTMLSLALLAAILSCTWPGAGYAQIQRTWVASFGSDANNCSRGQPCATFTRAVSQTLAGGEVNCVDPGDFGEVSITQSMTIDCDNVRGSITSVGFTLAVSINAAASDVVVLRGLELKGVGGGFGGVQILSAQEVHIEKCVISDQTAAGAGWGIYATPTSNIDIFVSDTLLTGSNGTGSGGGFIVVPRTSNGITKVVLNRVESRGNFFGIKADGTDERASGGVINMTIRDSLSAGNGSNGIVGTSNATGPAIVMMIDRSASSHNTAGYGVIADGPKTTIRLGSSSIAGNINGVGATNGGVLQSFKTNQIKGNSNDGTPLPAVGLD